MKTKYFFAICFLALALQMFGADGYKDSLMAVANRLETSWDMRSLEQCAGELEGLAAAHPGKWMPIYYAALCNIKTTYVCQSGKDVYFEKAGKHLDALKEFPAADASEVATLQGYYYVALTAADPQTNGRKYYTTVISLYDQAMELNPNNPRPACLKAHFCQYLPDAFRSDAQIAEDKRKATELFSRERPSPDKPYWGKYYLNLIKKQ